MRTVWAGGQPGGATICGHSGLAVEKAARPYADSLGWRAARRRDSGQFGLAGNQTARPCADSLGWRADRLRLAGCLWVTACGRLALAGWLWRTGCGWMAVVGWLWLAGCGWLAADLTARGQSALVLRRVSKNKNAVANGRGRARPVAHGRERSPPRDTAQTSQIGTMNFDLGWLPAFTGRNPNTLKGMSGNYSGLKRIIADSRCALAARYLANLAS